MNEQLPPLTPVRAFEQAGRYLNIARAAQELGVTQGAVSQHVKHLEKWLGCRLFRRTNRGLEFTEKGSEYFISVSSSFEELRRATASISRPSVRKSFVISVTASFAMKWLLPRLGDFRKRWDGIDISVATADMIGKFDPADGDVGIRYGLGEFGSFKSAEIIRDKLILVARPDLFPNGVSDEEIEIIRRVPLLVDRHQELIAGYPSWKEYLADFGLLHNSDLLEREFSQQWMVIEAAVNGEGVALVKECLAEDDLRAARLVRLGNQTIKANSGYYLVHLAENSNDPVIRSFRSWLLEALLQKR